MERNYVTVTMCKKAYKWHRQRCAILSLSGISRSIGRTFRSSYRKTAGYDVSGKQTFEVCM